MTPKPSIAELTIEEPSIRLAALTFEHEATSRVVAVVEQLVAQIAEEVADRTESPPTPRPRARPIARKTETTMSPPTKVKKK